MIYPFEIHITVEISTDTINQFKNCCHELGVKPIVLDINLDFFDAMTSSTVKTDSIGLQTEITRIKSKLIDSGFRVLREKIETAPWHPLSPVDTDSMPIGCYVESHFNVKTSTDSIELLKSISKQYNCHLSQNIFKKINETEFCQMMTIRSFSDNISTFNQKLYSINSELKDKNFVVEKNIIEFVIHDSNLQHDNKWVQHG